MNWIAQVLAVSCIGSLAVSCGGAPIAATPTPPSEEADMPTPASTLAQLMLDMSSEDPAVRLVSTYALERYGEGAVVAIPQLAVNLKDVDFDVRLAAAYVLGTLGPMAKASVPDLVGALQTDTYFRVRAGAAESLGIIGDLSAVPALAQCLLDDYGPSHRVAIACSHSIATITGERFRDSDSSVYQLDDAGLPLLVLDARQWWETSGRFMDW